MLRTRENAAVTLAASAVASPAGTFTLGPGREGEYAIVALPAGSPYPQAGEWDRLARLAVLGERITLAELDERVQDLRVLATDRR